MNTKYLSKAEAIAIALIAIGDVTKSKNMDQYLPNIGRNVVEYIQDGEVSKNFLTASLVITENLTTEMTVKIYELANLNLKNGDFAKYYDTELCRTYWVLGYFGGGSINIANAHKLAMEFAAKLSVPLSTIKIDEILNSRRHKGFKVMYSEQIHMAEGDEYIMENVWQMLTD